MLGDGLGLRRSLVGCSFGLGLLGRGRLLGGRRLLRGGRLLGRGGLGLGRPQLAQASLDLVEPVAHSSSGPVSKRRS